MNKRFLLAALLFLFTGTMFAQDRKQDDGSIHRVSIGLNLGAVTPTSLPNTIRRIDAYNPLLCPSIGYSALFAAKQHWWIGTGLLLDYKGMWVKDSVAYFHTMIQGNNGSASGFEGSFTGTNTTTVRNVYLTLPLYAQWTPGKNWSFQIGGYFAFLLRPKFEGHVSNGYIRNGGPLGEKVIVDYAEFDFSNKIRRYDYGLHAGIEKSLSSKWSASIHWQWGLCRLFPASFSGVDVPLKNMYVNVSLSYRLPRL
ncbi:MAG: PorT family protein [Bacteroidetes bacterium]|nr:PorT family protein [Bacteroidota bacterium]